MAFLKRDRDAGSKPSFVMSSISFDLSSNRSTTFSPHKRRETRHAEVHVAAAVLDLQADLDAAVLRQTLLGMSSFAMILTREISGSLKRSGRAMTL